MKNRTTLIIAAICGLLAVLLHRQFLNQQLSEAIGPYEKIPVVVAAQDILYNSRIEATMVTVEKIPKAYVQPQSLSDPNDAVGYLAALTINKGEQILKTKLSRFEDTHLALRIPEGMRAVAIGVSDVTGVNGLIRPGNIVDILATFKFKLPNEQKSNDSYEPQQLSTKTFILFQNILVMAVGNDYRFVNSPTANDQKDKNIYQTYARNVTVALPLKDTQKLIEAQSLGELTLALRSHFDTGQREELTPQTPYTVINSSEPIYVPKAAPYLDLRGAR